MPGFLLTSLSLVGVYCSISATGETQCYSFGKYRAAIWRFNKSSWILWSLSSSIVKCTVPKSEQSCGERSGSWQGMNRTQNRRQWASKLNLLHLWKQHCCTFPGRQKAGRFYCQDLKVTHCKKAKKSHGASTIPRAKLPVNTTGVRTHILHETHTGSHQSHGAMCRTCSALSACL